jgi:hypothetical protein
MTITKNVAHQAPIKKNSAALRSARRSTTFLHPRAFDPVAYAAALEVLG